jgi:transposase
MRKIQETLQAQSTTDQDIMYIAFELSNSTWRLAFSDGNKKRHVTIKARDLKQLEREIIKAKNRFGLKGDIPIKSCYEAGRDGFWIHRYLLSKGIDNLMVDSSSIEVSRRKRRAKSDRLDAGNLLRLLMRYHGNERQVWKVVTAPTVEEEDARHLHREIETLLRERTRYRNRIKALLAQHGLNVKNPSRKNFLKTFEALRSWDGQALPESIKSRAIREYERLTMIEDHIKLLKKEREQKVAGKETVSVRQVTQLRELCGIGVNSSWVFVMEFFGWRKFRNRREVAALAGLTPTPYDSGGSQREQGISKAGNKRIRTMAVEIAWCWLRFQPQSKLSQWFNERFAGGGSRMRRIGIVALARKLLIALWRYLEHGVIPEGAIIKRAL